MSSNEDANLWGTPPPTNNQPPAFGTLAPPPRRAAGPARAKTAEMLARLTAWQQQASSTSELDEDDAPTSTTDDELNTATCLSEKGSSRATSIAETDASAVPSVCEEEKKEPEKSSSFDGLFDSKDSSKVEAATDGHAARSTSASLPHRLCRRGGFPPPVAAETQMFKTFSSAEAAAAELEAVCWRGGGFPLVRHSTTKSTVSCLRNPGRCKWKAVARCRPRGSNDEGQPLSPLWWIMESDVNRKHSHRRNEKSREQSQRAGSATSLSSFETTPSQEHTSKAQSPAPSMSDLVQEQVEGPQKSPAPTSLAPQTSLQSTSVQSGPSTPIRRNVAAPPISWLRSSGQKPPPDYRPNIQHRPSEPSLPSLANKTLQAPSPRTPSIARPRSPQLQASLDEVARRVRSSSSQGAAHFPRRDGRSSFASSPSAQAGPSATSPQRAPPQPRWRYQPAPGHASSSAARLPISSQQLESSRVNAELRSRVPEWRAGREGRHQRYEPYSSVDRDHQGKASYSWANQRYSRNAYDPVRRGRFASEEILTYNGHQEGRR